MTTRDLREISDELLPCPFCGGDARHFHTDDTEGCPNWNGEVIGCVDCGASTKLAFSSKEPAIEHLTMLWNRRLRRPTASPGELEGLREKHVRGIDSVHPYNPLQIDTIVCKLCRVRWPCDFIQADDARRELADRYNELIYAVGSKYPGQTRHETALMYIQRCEQPSEALARASQADGDGGEEG